MLIFNGKLFRIQMKIFAVHRSGGLSLAASGSFTCANIHRALWHAARSEHSRSFLLLPARAQQSDAGKPVVVQPGAPGSRAGRFRVDEGHASARSQADVEFMQDMIMHHSQAVEMTLFRRIRRTRICGR